MDPASFIFGIGAGLAIGIAYYEFSRGRRRGPDGGDQNGRSG
jgi:hypothetical protein